MYLAARTFVRFRSVLRIYGTTALRMLILRLVITLTGSCYVRSRDNLDRSAPSAIRSVVFRSVRDSENEWENLIAARQQEDEQKRIENTQKIDFEKTKEKEGMMAQRSAIRPPHDGDLPYPANRSKKVSFSESREEFRFSEYIPIAEDFHSDDQRVKRHEFEVVDDVKVWPTRSRSAVQLATALRHLQRIVERDEPVRAEEEINGTNLTKQDRDDDVGVISKKENNYEFDASSEAVDRNTESQNNNSEAGFPADSKPVKAKNSKKLELNGVIEKIKRKTELQSPTFIESATKVNQSMDHLSNSENSSPRFDKWLRKLSNGRLIWSPPPFNWTPSEEIQEKQQPNRGQKKARKERPPSKKLKKTNIINFGAPKKVDVIDRRTGKNEFVGESAIKRPIAARPAGRRPPLPVDSNPTAAVPKRIVSSDRRGFHSTRSMSSEYLSAENEELAKSAAREAYRRSSSGSSVLSITTRPTKPVKRSRRRRRRFNCFRKDDAS